MTDDVVVLEPGDERAQKIAKAMASQTANDILTLLAAGARSLTDITEHLRIPLTTAKYHTENLLDAGLITVSETRYSIKGREVKIYALSDRLLIVAPKNINVRDILLKYSSLFGIVVAGTLVVIALSPTLSSRAVSEAVPMATPSVGSGAGVYGANILQETAVVPAATLDPALAFFLGGVLVIFILLCYEAYLWKKWR